MTHSVFFPQNQFIDCKKHISNFRKSFFICLIKKIKRNNNELFKILNKILNSSRKCAFLLGKIFEKTYGNFWKPDVSRVRYRTALNNVSMNWNLDKY